MRKMSILGEQGALEEKHLYRLASGMAAGGKQEETQLTPCLFMELLISETPLKRYLKFVLGITGEIFLH